MVAGEHSLDAAPHRQVERAEQRLRKRPWTGLRRGSRNRPRAAYAHAAVSARRNSSSGFATAASTRSRIESASTSSASAW